MSNEATIYVSVSTQSTHSTGKAEIAFIKDLKDQRGKSSYPMMEHIVALVQTGEFEAFDQDEHGDRYDAANAKEVQAVLDANAANGLSRNFLPVSYTPGKREESTDFSALLDAS